MSVRYGCGCFAYAVNISPFRASLKACSEHRQQMITEERVQAEKDAELIPVKTHADLHEVVWEVGRHYGYELSVPDQVIVVELLSRRHRLATGDVREALLVAGVKQAPAGYAAAVAREARKLATRRSRKVASP